MKTKACGICKATKSVAEFHRHKKESSGLSYCCKSCKAVRAKAQYAALSPEKKAAIIERNRRYRKEHPEVVRAYQRRYCNRNPDRRKRTLTNYTRMIAEQKRRPSDLLTDGYIAVILGLPKSSVPAPLLEVTRAHIALRRAIKEVTNDHDH